MSKLSFLSFHGSFSKKPSSSPKPTLPHTHSKDLLHKPSTRRSKSFQPCTEEIRKVFNKLDANGDGKISLEEYAKAIDFLSGSAAKGEVAQTFRVADADGDGFIDLDEFSKVYGGDGGVKRSEIEAAFRVFDCNGDGRISAAELMEVLRRMGEKCSLQGCKDMIKGVDRDGDGLIDKDEFTNMMKQNTKYG